MGSESSSVPKHRRVSPSPRLYTANLILVAPIPISTFLLRFFLFVCFSFASLSWRAPRRVRFLALTYFLPGLLWLSTGIQKTTLANDLQECDSGISHAIAVNVQLSSSFDGSIGDGQNV